MEVKTRGPEAYKLRRTLVAERSYLEVSYHIETGYADDGRVC